ncbi:unnamed protein product [Phytomonas sp. EM1]|nr:unnamed protein product [Phytomonas sp. EM1]|eukprot:CCW61576.1 unnamed protein product [Phytomonas sp. isolate EM1]
MEGDTAHYYEVLYSFTAEEDAELSVQKGERLRLIDPTIRDGWVRVEVCSEPDRQGFVPVSYLNPKKVSNSTADDSGATEVKLSLLENTTLEGNPLDASSIQNRGDLMNYSQISSQAQDQSRILGSMKSESPKAPPVEGNAGVHSRQRGDDQITTRIAEHGNFFPQPVKLDSICQKVLNDESHISKAFTNEFIRNQTYFDQLMRRRTDALVDIRTCLKDTMADIEACKEKSALLSQRLSEMVQITEKEHLRRVENMEEVKLCVRRSLMHPFGVTPQNTNLDTGKVMGEHF